MIKNYPYLDPYGRETITFVREYSVRSRPSRFDATMVLAGGRLVDYLGRQGLRRLRPQPTIRLFGRRGNRQRGRVRAPIERAFHTVRLQGVERPTHWQRLDPP